MIEIRNRDSRSRARAGAADAQIRFRFGNCNRERGTGNPEPGTSCLWPSPVGQRRSAMVPVVVVLLVAIGVATAPSLEACATCFGASDSDMARGMNMGIMSLLGVLGLVLGSVASFFGYLAWRAARLGRSTDVAEAVEWETT